MRGLLLSPVFYLLSPLKGIHLHFHASLSVIVKQIESKGLFAAFSDKRAIHHCNHRMALGDRYPNHFAIELAKIKLLLKLPSIRFFRSIGALRLTKREIHLTTHYYTISIVANSVVKTLICGLRKCSLFSVGFV